MPPTHKEIREDDIEYLFLEMSGKLNDDTLDDYELIQYRKKVLEKIAKDRDAELKGLLEVVEGMNKPKPSKSAVDELGRPNLSPTEYMERSENRGFNLALSAVASKILGML